jgi:hypothetical protein
MILATRTSAGELATLWQPTGTLKWTPGERLVVVAGDVPNQLSTGRTVSVPENRSWVLSCEFVRGAIGPR